MQTTVPELEPQIWVMFSFSISFGVPYFEPYSSEFTCKKKTLFPFAQGWCPVPAADGPEVAEGPGNGKSQRMRCGLQKHNEARVNRDREHKQYQAQYSSNTAK